MELVIVCTAALFASILTLFSGFGLGTLLMSVVALFFSLELAIAITVMVHRANNLFMIGLPSRKVDSSVLMKFGLPAIGAALAGGALLTHLGDSTLFRTAYKGLTPSTYFEFKFTAVARYLTSTVGFRWWLAERIDRIYLVEQRGG